MVQEVSGVDRRPEVYINMREACKARRQTLDNPRECHQLSCWSTGWRIYWTLWRNLRSGAVPSDRVGQSVHETDKLGLKAEVWVTAERGGGGVCKPALVIRALGRKVSLGAGEKGQHLLEGDCYLCVHHHSNSHTVLHETQLYFTPFFWTSRPFSFASSDCERCSEV